MTPHHLVAQHALAIFIAALVAFLVGAFWYSPLLFAKAWIRAHGYTSDEVKAMQANASRAYAGTFVAFLLMAFVLNLFLQHLGADSVRDGVGWAFHAWLGFALPVGFTAYLYSHKSIGVFLIDAGYQLTYMLLMGAILGAALVR